MCIFGKNCVKLIYIRALFSNVWKLYIGVMFVTTLLLFYPILLLFLYVEPWKAKTFKVNICWSRLMRMLCFYGVDVRGDAPTTQGEIIICANHTSYLDIFMLYSALPQQKFIFMGKSEILSYPLVKTFFKRLNIPVFRGDRLKAAKSFIKAKQELLKGWSIVIFPEGGIPDDPPYIIPFKDGAFKLAKSAEVGVLPVTFINNYRLFSDPELVLGSAMPGLVKLKIHPFISAAEHNELSVMELNQKVFEFIASSIDKKV